MNIKELAENQAVAVAALGSIEIHEGDAVLVGIKCVFSKGKYIPITPTFKLTPNIFDVVSPGEIVVVKRINSQTQTEQNEQPITGTS